MIAVQQQLLQALQSALDSMASQIGITAVLERPKVASHGDWACTAALQLAKPLAKSPRQVAQELHEKLLQYAVIQEWVGKIEIAGPGFLNFHLKPVAKQQVIRDILEQQEHFGYQPLQNQKIIVEFVSANPTGPLHVGHGRQAALGDAICHLLATQGWQVWREFYYNDAGVQIQTLALSVQARLLGFSPGDEQWPENAYNGEYIADIAKQYNEKATVVADDRSVTALGDPHDLDAIREFAVAYLRHEQDLDLHAFSLRFDHFYLESSLYSEKKVEAVVQRLIEQGKTYEKDGALWLKTSEYGDDKDRVMRKSDGSYTYFVPDIAYHVSKFERGFTRALNIQGTDHHGTIARVRAGLQALQQEIPAHYPDYVLHTMVRVVRAGQEVKISKRAGSYVTLRDLIEWTSKDAVRFFLLSRKPDTEYTFDVDLAIAKNNDNPVYYVQYAHARIQSILQSWGGQANDLSQVDLSSLDSLPAQSLMMVLSRYPEMLTMAAHDFAPHDVTFYLRELAAAYHAYYDAERILIDNETIRLARLALIAAVAQVLRNGLQVLGVSAPIRM